MQPLAIVLSNLAVSGWGVFSVRNHMYRVKSQANNYAGSREQFDDLFTTLGMQFRPSNHQQRSPSPALPPLPLLPKGKAAAPSGPAGRISRFSTSKNRPTNPPILRILPRN